MACILADSYIGLIVRAYDRVNAVGIQLHGAGKPIRQHSFIQFRMGWCTCQQGNEEKGQYPLPKFHVHPLHFYCITKIVAKL